MTDNDAYLSDPPRPVQRALNILETVDPYVVRVSDNVELNEAVTMLLRVASGSVSKHQVREFVKLKFPSVGDLNR